MPEPRQVSGPIAGREWNDIQLIEFKVDDIAPCDQARILRFGRTLVERLGDDTRSGFLIVDGASYGSPPLSRGTFLGITGPNRGLRTPFIGGIPNVRPKGFNPGIAVLEENPLGLKGLWAIQASMPTEVTSRDIPANLQFVNSTPRSLSPDSLDVVSVTGLSADVSMVDRVERQKWSRISTGATIYLAVGGSIVAALIYDLVRGSVNASQRPLASTGRPPDPSSKAANQPTSDQRPRRSVLTKNSKGKRRSERKGRRRR
jgi:hypothetical protein